MGNIRDALLKSIHPDVIIQVHDIEGNKKKLDKLFNELRTLLAAHYVVFADTEKYEIMVQYK